MTKKKLLFSFKNRIGRRDYWIGYAFNFLLFLIPMIIFAVYGAVDIFKAQNVPVPDWLAMITTPNGKAIATLIIIPLLIAGIWSGLAIFVKRLHDLNLTGWLSLTLILTIVPILGVILFFVLPIVMGCISGTPGPNKYGPDPLAKT